MSKKKDLNNQREIACLRRAPAGRPHSFQSFAMTGFCHPGRRAGNQASGMGKVDPRSMHAGMTGVMLVFAIPQLQEGIYATKRSAINFS
jgi:hypothetical protein